MDVHRVYEALLRGFRRRRMARFVARHRPDETTRVLDVGGSPFNWELCDARPRVTLLNLHRAGHGGELPARFARITASGTQLPYPDGAFDVAFSNSVIEHLGSYESQWSFAAQLRRVAPRLWVQTPARWFPFEPHLLTPFVHYLPRRLQAWLIRHFTVWGWLARPSRDQVACFVRDTRLLTRREMQSLFPDCEIHCERFLGLAKSYVAIR